MVQDPRLSIATTLLPGGDLQLPYFETIVATGGSGSGHSWRISAGTLPPGLTPLLLEAGEVSLPLRWPLILCLYDLVFALLAYALFDYLVED